MYFCQGELTFGERFLSSSGIRDADSALQALVDFYSKLNGVSISMEDKKKLNSETDT